MDIEDLSNEEIEDVVVALFMNGQVQELMVVLDYLETERNYTDEQFEILDAVCEASVSTIH